MNIQHRYTDDAIWVEIFASGNELIAYAKFVNKDDILYSASTYVTIINRNKNLATAMYMYMHDLGYHIRPSKLQSPEGKAMWKAFRKANLPFVPPTLIQRIVAML